MTEYLVYATRFDDAHIVETLLPARGLSFSMPVSDHGECSFSATVEPGRSDWRAAVGLPFSGVLITRDGQPWWSGQLNPERQTGPRTFSFSAKEWGSFFDGCPTVAADYASTNSHAAIRDLIATAQAVPGQDVKVTTDPSTVGKAFAGVQVKAWDTMTVADVLRNISAAAGGPEWYVGTSGTLENPQRPLIIADQAGNATVQGDAVLQYVEQTEDFTPAESGRIFLLSSGVFQTGTAVQSLDRRGGNVLALGRDRDLSRSATQVIATGNGDSAAQLRKKAVADKLLAQGWPRITKYTDHGGVDSPDLLQRLANADLATMGGIATRYSIATLDGDPDWTQIPRGSMMRVILDTDVYALPRPYTFETRVLKITVSVGDDGPAQVQWDLAETMEVS